jgi:DNA end-binding protein Ku
VVTLGVEFVDRDDIDSRNFEKPYYLLPDDDDADNELRKPESYFDEIPPAKASADAVKLAVNLIEEHAGKFEPQKMPNEYARAVHELVQAKIEQRAPEVEIEAETRETPKIVNIMDALKKSMQAREQGKVSDAVRRRMGKEPASGKSVRLSKGAKPTTGARRSVH